MLIVCYYYYMSTSDIPTHDERVRTRRHVISSFKAKSDARRTAAERFADWMTDYFGTVTFLLLNAAWFVSWIVINLGLIPGIEPFDPFPFGLLTMVVSLEAIFLAIIVLISQNREAHIADVREEIDLQINTISEEEITKVIKMLAMLLEKNGINADNDPEVQRMLRPIQSGEIERRLEEQINRNGKHK